MLTVLFAISCCTTFVAVMLSTISVLWFSDDWRSAGRGGKDQAIKDFKDHQLLSLKWFLWPWGLVSILKRLSKELVIVIRTLLDSWNYVKQTKENK